MKPTSCPLLPTSFVQAIVWLPFLLPFYVWRVRIGLLPTTVLEIGLILLFVAFTWKRGWSGWSDGWKRLEKWRAPIVAWLVVTLFAVIIAPDKIVALGLWRAYVLEPLLVFVMLGDIIRTEEETLRLRYSLFVTVILLTVWAVFQFVTGQGIPSPWNVAIADGRRATGPYPFPNALSLFVTPIGAWAFASWIKKREKLACVAWIAALVAILLARSDGGLVAFLCVAVLGAVLETRTRKIAFAILLTVALAFIAVPFVRHKVWTAVSFQEWSGQVRVTIWRETVAMLKDSPLFGAGFGAYPTVIKPYHRATYLEIFQYPHNILLNFWSETGVLGVIVFAWIAMTWVRIRLGSFRSSVGEHSYAPCGSIEVRQAQGLSLRETFSGLAPLIAILIHGLVDVPYFKNDLAIAFWILVFLCTIRLDHSPEKR